MAHLCHLRCARRLTGSMFVLTGAQFRQKRELFQVYPINFAVQILFSYWILSKMEMQRFGNDVAFQAFSTRGHAPEEAGGHDGNGGCRYAAGC